MTTYKQAGVDILMGDKCSAIAYAAAKKTFSVRKNMIGAPVNLEDGFTGMLDFGDFYLVQNSDGVGSKIMIAEMIHKFDTLGYDLLAMVADDAVCVGAETISINNTIDTKLVTDKVVRPLMEGLKKACIEQKIVIPGGEIGEMPDLVKGNIWNSSAVGIVEKDKFINAKNVKAGDPIIALRSRGFRSNGFALVRKILQKKFGAQWFQKKYNNSKGWGEAVLTPSLIYSGALLSMLGRYKEPRLIEIKALAHVTGGGIPGNIGRVLGKYGAVFHELWEPHDPMLQLQKMGSVEDREAYEVWNMGSGMLLISSEFEKIQKMLKKHAIEARIVGEVTKQKGIQLISKGYFKKGKKLSFD